MKSIKNIKLLMVVGLLLQVGIGFARNNDFAEQGKNIVAALKRFDGKSDSNWQSTGPTEEDILASTRIDNLAAKGSLEEKIIHAAQNGDYKNIVTLIVPGADIEARDNQDRTALMRAAEKGYCQVVKILLDAGAHVSTHDQFGWTALFMAVDKNHAEVVKILIARSAASSQKRFEEMFVHSALKGNAQMVKALAGDGAHISSDIVNQAFCMVNYGNPEMVAILKHLQSQYNDSEIND